MLVGPGSAAGAPWESLLLLVGLVHCIRLGAVPALARRALAGMHSFHYCRKGTGLAWPACPRAGSLQVPYHPQAFAGQQQSASDSKDSKDSSRYHCPFPGCKRSFQGEEAAPGLFVASQQAGLPPASCNCPLWASAHPATHILQHTAKQTLQLYG